MNIAYAAPADMLEWAEGVMARPFDFGIGPSDDLYLLRWWIVPRNEAANAYLHRIMRSDDDRALHDHPWDNTSIVIKGRYVEHLPDGSAIMREAGSVVHRKATDAHRLEILPGEECITLFMTGPKLREWGFHCPNGWVHWRDFTGGDNGEIVGAGCGEA